MTQTHPDAPADRSDEGPQLNRDQIHRLDQLRRSRSDRYVAGVAGGLGRHFGIDPTVIRVLLAAACVFGGAGVLFYAVLWLTVPDDEGDRAMIHLGGETRRIVVLVAGAIAAIALMGDAWGGFGRHGLWAWGIAWPIGIIIVVVAVVGGFGQRRAATGRPGPAGVDTAWSSATAPAAEAPSGPASAMGVPGAPTPPPPTTWAAPAPSGPPPPAVPSRPRRTGPILFWPTLALLAVGFGLLGLYDAHHHVAPGAYAALGLSVIGAMLVLGAFVGRAGGLILLGLLSLPALVVSSVAGGAHWQGRTVHYQPASSTQVRGDYHLTNGNLVVDLSGVSDAGSLSGRTVVVRFRAGQAEVDVPPGVAVEVDASLGVAGDIDVDGRNWSGVGPSVSRTVINGGTSAEPLVLDVHGKVGRINIETQE